jgi:hypothetical protein
MFAKQISVCGASALPRELQAIALQGSGAWLGGLATNTGCNFGRAKALEGDFLCFANALAMVKHRRCRERFNQIGLDEIYNGPHDYILPHIAYNTYMIECCVLREPIKY